MNLLSFEDAWIFLGIKYAENEAQDYYAGLVGNFYYINHSMPGYEQFITAYNKLLYLSVINKAENRIPVSEFGNVIYLNGLAKSTPATQPREMAEIIFAELKPYKLKSACRQSPLSAEEYAVAIKMYLEKNNHINA
ncbi:hypothetical protein [Cellvibrio mixtus]|uniref:hypothetical protein n=1 Tax=Cellvibrio mixtus TaxID=39650 RepID=UPI0005868110|nr:hypothetical protein [Cellvibrio mixtus]